MQANILVLHHHAAGFEISRHIERLLKIACGRVKAAPQIGFVAVLGEGDAIDRANIGASVAFNAERVRKHRLHVAIQAAFGLLIGQLLVKPELDFHANIAERGLLSGVRNPVTRSTRISLS